MFHKNLNIGSNLPSGRTDKRWAKTGWCSEKF